MIQYPHCLKPNLHLQGPSLSSQRGVRKRSAPKTICGTKTISKKMYFYRDTNITNLQKVWHPNQIPHRKTRWRPKGPFHSHPARQGVSQLCWIHGRAVQQRSSEDPGGGGHTWGIWLPCWELGKVDLGRHFFLQILDTTSYILISLISGYHFSFGTDDADWQWTCLVPNGSWCLMEYESWVANEPWIMMGMHHDL